MADDSQTHARAAGLKKVAERVAYIRDMMERLEWTRGVTGPLLAEVWECSLSAVQNYSAEASRQITGDEDEARRDITVGARKLFKQALDDGDAKSLKLMGDLWATVSGARAPEKREHTVTGFGIEELDARRKIAENNEE